MRRLGLLLPMLWAGPLLAQELPPGVQLRVGYENIFRPKLAVRSFTGSGELAAVAQQMQEIIRRDLELSDRFQMVSTPPSLDSGPLDYRPWLDLGVDLLVTGSVEPWQNGSLLRLTLHDVIYSRVNQIRAFAMPGPSAGDFRMSVHATADELVLWATGQPGMAASRVAFTREARDGGFEIMLVDSDGENLRRLVHAPEQILRSVSWSTDGSRIVYTAQDIELGMTQILERDLTTGALRVLSDQVGLNMTPAYSPDGARLAFARSRGSTLGELYDMDAERRCCIRQLTQAPANFTDMAPSYSPDGRQIVYQSDRLGQSHLYIRSAEPGGTAQPLTVYVQGRRAEYHAPDWAPIGTRIAFHGRSEAGYQLMLADAARPGGPVYQITNEGSSEDPSWAPDARHLVFAGNRATGRGVYIIDTVTRAIRPLAVGGKYMLPAWSPALKKAADLAVTGF